MSPIRDPTLLGAQAPVRAHVRNVDVATRSMRPGTRQIMVSSIYLTLATGVNLVLGYAYWGVAARLYTPYEVGLTAALVSAMLLVATVGTMGLGAGVAYVLPAAGLRWSGTVNGVLLAAAGLAALLGLLLAVGAAGVNPEFAQVVRSAPFVAIFVASGTVWTCGLVLDAILTVEGAGLLVLLRSIVFGLLRLAVLPLARSQGAGSSEVVLFGDWGASALLSIVVIAALFGWRNPRRRRLSWAVDLSGVRELLPLSFQNHALITVASLPTLVLPLLVSSLLSVEASAYFYAASMVAAGLTTIPVSAAAALFSHAATSMRLTRGLLSKVLLATLAVLVPLAGIVIVGRDIILSLFGEQYAGNSSGLIVLLSIVALPSSVFQIYLAASRIRKTFGQAMKVGTTLSLTSLMACALLMQPFGLLGIGAGLLVTHSVAALFCLQLLRRTTKESEHYAPLYA